MKMSKESEKYSRRTKHKFDFIVRICLYYTSFMNEFEITCSI